MSDRGTVYLAASSALQLAASGRMNELADLGYRSAFDWTQCLNAPESLYPVLAEQDVEAAAGCDLFVIVVEPKSYGAMLELGARLGSGRAAHVVGAGDHFFLRHPLVIRHESWEAFLDVATRGVR